ncbi:GST6 protein [Cocos nucifera]|uniref:Glutathione S-transferase n=1 Tax=Cocos nucifera TaxID=13894 RepID=A0A8K0N407_COCNU|nr:GST6 protein [Cocos nucifera]
MAAAAEKGVVLLDFWVSPFGQRCRIALAEKGVEYEYKEENLSDKSPLLLKMNPVHKKIPVLIHHGKPICESLIIVQYIEEVWSHNPLLPSNPYERAKARFWADFVDKKVAECGTRLWKLKGEAQEEAKKDMIEILKLLEGELGDKKYFGGEKTFGFVDVALAPFTAWFYTYETCGKFSIENECPKLAAWAKRCKERKTVSESLHDPHKVYEYVGKLKKKYGVE